MSLIAYSEFVNRVRKLVFPDLDNDGNEGHLEPSNLGFPHRTYIQNALITTQTYVECLRQNNVNTYTLDDATVNCGVGVFSLPDHVRVGAVYAYKPTRGCKRLHFDQRSVNKIMCFVDQFSSCKCKDESDICNAVRTGDQVCDNLSLCDTWEGEEDDKQFKCENRIFAVGAGGRLYVAPRIPCGYRLAVHWEGLKYRYEDADLITDDPDLLDVVATYLQAERARTFDRDLQLYQELLGKGAPIHGKNGSAFHTKVIAMAHRCREERRIRTRPCLEMWDDSAVSSENIGAQLNPVPDREDAGIEFERCDGCPEGQFMLDGVCTDCLTPVVSLSASDTTLVTGQSVTLIFSSSNIISLDSSSVVLEAAGVSVTLTPNDSGSLSFTPTTDTTYTIRANTVCGNATATVSIAVNDDAGCPCPLNTADCLRIMGFDDYTFLDRALITSMVQQSFTDAVDGPISDLSGLTYNPLTGTVFGIKNVNSGDSEIYEWDQSGNMLRWINTTNFADTEGLAWMYGTTYAIAEENPNQRITIVTIDSTTELIDRNSYLAASFATGISAGNLGIEGITYDSTRGLLYFTTEKPVAGVWTLYSMNPANGDLATVATITTSIGAVATDLSDMYFDANSDHLFLLSQESSKVIEITLAGVVVRQLALTGFTQPEGLTFNPNMTQMWVAGEPREFARYEGTLAQCATGVDSIAAAWDGTLERVGETCAWGFAVGIKSYRDQNVSAFVLLDHCENDGTPVFRLQIVAKTADGVGVIWSGTSNNTPIGTYTRDSDIDCGPGVVEVNGCECDDSTASIAFDPPSGSGVSFPTTVFLTSSDETAIIYYTTDGSDPTNNSTVYSGPVSLVSGDTIKARAYTSNCVGNVYSANYTEVEGLAFDFICDTVDRAGVFGVFAPNGSNDYHWALSWEFAESKTIKRFEIYESNSQGVWVTGQAWATQSPIYPAEITPNPFTVYPLVVDDENAAQINSAYGATIGTYSATPRAWQLYGQPFVPLTGYFKLLFVLDDGSGGDEVIYKLIPHDCYYSSDYTDPGFDEPENPTSENIINVDLKHTSTSAKSGAAAVGLAGDFWNTLNFGLTFADHDPIALKWANGTDVYDANGFTSRVGTGDSNGELTGIFYIAGTTDHQDAMMQNNAVVPPNNYQKFIWATYLPRGRYDVYVYGHGANPAEVLNCQVTTSSSATAYKHTAVGTEWNGDFASGVNYVKFEGIEWANSEAASLRIVFQNAVPSWVSGVQFIKRS